MSDLVRHPPHYQGKGGVECIEVTEWLPFNVGNAFKYVYRREAKNAALQDTRKALWYTEREIARRASLEREKREPDASTEPSEVLLKTYRISDAETDRRFAAILDALVEGHVLNSDNSFEYAATLLREVINESEGG